MGEQDGHQGQGVDFQGVGEPEGQASGAPLSRPQPRQAYASCPRSSHCPYRRWLRPSAAVRIFQASLAVVGVTTLLWRGKDSVADIVSWLLGVEADTLWLMGSIPDYWVLSSLLGIALIASLIVTVVSGLVALGEAVATKCRRNDGMPPQRCQWCPQSSYCPCWRLLASQRPRPSLAVRILQMSLAVVGGIAILYFGVSFVVGVVSWLTERVLDMPGSWNLYWVTRLAEPLVVIVIAVNLPVAVVSGIVALCETVAARRHRDDGHDDGRDDGQFV